MSKTIKGGEKESRECPNCHSKQIWKDGIRKTRNGFVQRFLCRDCVYRFSDNPYKQCQSNNNHQLCVIKKAKKLDNPTKIKIVAVDKKNTQKGQIIQFCFHLKKQGYAEATIKLRYSVLKVLME